MKVVILAAGEGVRLRPITNTIPKCLVPLAGKPLLARQLEALRLAGPEDISIVTGYRSDAVKKMFPDLHFFDNTDYATTNMVYSLICASEILESGEDILVAYSDIVYEPHVITALLAAESAPLRIACNTEWEACWRLRMENPLDDAETFKIDDTGRITELGRKASSRDEIQGQYMGLFILDGEIAGKLPTLYASWPDEASFEGRKKKNIFMTALLQHLLDGGVVGKPVLVPGGWLEVDTLDDLRLYESLHERGSLKEICNIA